TTGSLATASAITNNATLAFNRSNALTQGTDFASVIGGTGGLQQLGAGTTTLTGGNTYTGATTISAGTLQLGNGGTTGSLATASAITNNATLAFNRSNALTQGTDFASVIGGTGGLQQLGAGTTTLSGNNSYSGTTSVIAGVLRASHANALGTTAGGTSVTSGAALELIGGIAIGAEALGLNGSGITSAGALRNISGTNSHAGLITLNGATRINSDSGLLTLSGGFSGAQNLTIGGAGGTTLSGDLAIGAGTLTKDAAGVLTLSAASTRSGGTAFSGATLVVGAQGALGSGSVTGTSSSVLAFNTATNATFSNAMTLASAEQNSIRNNSTNSTVTLNGNIAGSGPSFFTFVGTGASNAGFVLGGSNTFTGTRVVVKDTSLTIANNSAVNAPGFPRVSLGDGGGSGAAVYLLDGINLNVKVVDANNTAITGPMAFTVGMKTAGTSTISGTSTANVAIDLHALSTGGTNNTWKFEAVSGATANFTGAIINTGTNAQAPITKTGLGTVVFSGANTYGGDTTVEAGTLSLATARLHDASTVRIASGAVLALTHGLSDRVDKLYLNGVYQPAGTYGATTPGGYISGSGSLLVTNGPTNDAPLANNQTLATPMDTVTPLVLTGTDPEGAALTFHILENPSHGTLTGTAPNLNYMPATGFVGVDRLTFTVNDGILTSSAATVLISVTPVTVAGLWQAYETAILNAPLNKELLLTSVQGAITIEQIRYDLGELVGTQVTASPKIAAYYAYPTTGTNLPGIVAIHGGGQQASVSEAVYWASQGYACMSINWGGNPLTDLAGGSLLPNTDWDQLAAGFTRTGVTQAIDHESTSPASFSDGVTLFAEPHPFNNSYCLYSYAARRAMTYLAAQPNVNGNKLGVTGHSMGGVITVMTGTDSRATCITPSVGGVVAEQNSYWPEIHCPTLFLEASNDWHAPFDQVVTSMALQAESVPQRLAVAPHFSHRFNTTAEAARVLWQKAHLTESFAFPQTATAQLDLTQSDGIPVFSVWPDESTASTVVGVDVYYGYDRDPLARFWRDGQAVKINGHWQAKCPVYDLNEPLVAFAVVTYDCGFNFTMQAGYTSPTRNFSVASEVRRVDPPDLSASGVRATEIRLPQIDDFARAYHDWYLLESASTTYFECWTRKLLDPSWAGPAGGELAFDVLTTSPGNVLGVKILVGQNDMNAQTYVAIIPVTANGTNSVSIPVGAFTHEITGAALANWGRLPVLGVMTGKRAKPGDATLPTWTGSVPVLSNLRWVGGSYPENYLIHDVPKAWLIGYGLAATDAVALADSDGDGKSNWEEFIAGTHPLNAALLLKMEAAGVAADRFVFKWQAVSGKTYRIETKTNLMDPAWTVLQTGIPGVAPECTGSVPMSGTSGFIRVAVE
ncbi:MAG: autotransporter-associated beta strand repeat-containing protein, partial [Verrucomicrobiota bacterium]